MKIANLADARKLFAKRREEREVTFNQIIIKLASGDTLDERDSAFVAGEIDAGRWDEVGASNKVAKVQVVQRALDSLRRHEQKLTASGSLQELAAKKKELEKQLAQTEQQIRQHQAYAHATGHARMAAEQAVSEAVEFFPEFIVNGRVDGNAIRAAVLDTIKPAAAA